MYELKPLKISCLLMLGLCARAFPAYLVGPYISTATGQATYGIAGTFYMAASSVTSSTHTIVLNGPSGNITASSGTYSSTVTALDFSGNGSGLTNVPVSTTEISGIIPIAEGGTGSSTAVMAISNLSAAASGANADITSLNSLSSINNGVSISSSVVIGSSVVFLTANSPGADFSKKIENCLSSLPTSGGVCDARGITGTQTGSQTVTISTAQAVLLGPVNATWSVLPMFNIYGMGAKLLGVASQLPNLGTNLIASASSGYGIQVSTNGAMCVYCEIGGFNLNMNSQAGTSDGMHIFGSQKTWYHDFEIINSSANGIYMGSAFPNGSDAGGVYFNTFDRIEINNIAQNGLELFSTTPGHLNDESFNDFSDQGASTDVYLSGVDTAQDNVTNVVFKNGSFEASSVNAVVISSATNITFINIDNENTTCAYQINNAAGIAIVGGTIQHGICGTSALSSQIVNTGSLVLVGAGASINSSVYIGTGTMNTGDSWANKFQVYGGAKFGGSSAQTFGEIGLGDDQSTNYYNGIFRGTDAGALGGGNTLTVEGFDQVNLTDGGETNGFGAGTIDLEAGLAGAHEVVLPTVTTGVVLCLTAAHVIGHCTSGASCLSTCTCTCTAN